MAKKIKATRTINPLHFEDLEPHRFEDLVRRLLYGFKDWSNIEATGRAGSDEGFDVRAWEKGEAVTNISDEGEEGSRDLEGRLWQIQGKREKSITPGKIRAIIKEGVDEKNPPYGYILAAATNISKAAYDAFREELRGKGVTELHFWGKDYLEDQLALPQNDEILFTFFGLSLSPRRRSRTSEIKFTINNKNKILRLIFGSDQLSGQSVPRGKGFLLRDIKAEHYPHREEYPDFDKHRRWEEHDVEDVTPRGIIFSARERYAYFDRTKKEWDFSTAIDLIPRKHNIDQSNQARLEQEGKKVERYWRHLPRRVQAKLKIYGFVPFGDILIIDDKGDPEYVDPHIFIDFGPHGPFQYLFANLVQNHEVIDEGEIQKFKRVTIFPEQFPDVTMGSVRDINMLGLRDVSVRGFDHLRGPTTLYSFSKINDLSVNDLIRIPKDPRDQNSQEKYAEVTHIYSTTVGTILKEQGEHYRSRLELDAGRTVTDSDEVMVHEAHEVSIFETGINYVGNWEW